MNKDNFWSVDRLLPKIHSSFSENKTSGVPLSTLENAVPDKIVPISLSMNIFLYDALLKIDKNYAKTVLLDIDEKFGKMLDEGATTFWETELGYKDFNMRGSLCHAWSALPILYYNLLNGKDYFDGKL